jgi:endonuclease/exonuclease/phosphatase family metal-dependent hydrolase
MVGSTRARVKASPGAVFRWLWLLATVPVVALSVFRAIPAEWPVLVVQLLSFTPWLAVPAAAALILAFLGRSRWRQAAAVVLVVCHVFWLFPLDTARPAAAAGRPAVQLKVMNLNSEFGQADAREIVRLVRDNGVALLAIQEHTQGLQDQLSAEGLDRLLPNRISEPTNDAGGSAVYSRYPMELVGVVPDTPFRMPTVRVTAESGGAVAMLEVTSVHVLPPVDVRVAQWRSDLAAVGRVAERPGNRLLIGDFNATYDHAEFREILTRGAGSDGEAAGLVDVGAASGSRLVPTWPMEGQLLPGITIDHLVTSHGLASSGYEVHRVPGTDHAAVLATLAIPAG